MRIFTSHSVATATIITTIAASASAVGIHKGSFDLAQHRYQIESPSVFNNNKTKGAARINSLLGADKAKIKFENPDPAMTLPASSITGNIDTPDGKLWYYTGELEYLEIPPHDDVYFTERILQEYKFTIYDSEMKPIGEIKDKMDYQENESNTVLCDIAPVATRNFFNSDDSVEIMVSLGVNSSNYTNHYRTLIYSLDAEKDADGYCKPIGSMPDLVADVVQGPSSDGSDNFYITFLSDVMEDVSDDAGFWDYMLAQGVDINIYSKAIDNNGPRLIYNKKLPLAQYPGDQQDVPALISLRRGDDVIYCFSQYQEPFYNRYDDPFSEDMTQRADNNLVIQLFKATETGLDLFSTTNVPVTLDPMNDNSGNPTCLFSFYSVGSLNYRNDIQFDAPGASAEKPDFVITRSNYQITTDDFIDSYFTYKNDGSLKNTLFLYCDGTRALGDIQGFEPQQMFVSVDSFGYLYNFVDLYSGKNVTQIDANYYYDNDTKVETLLANFDRTPEGDSFVYVFELRNPGVDDFGNDVMRFMYINSDGAFNHIESVNMGKDVAYAQSYLSTEALAPHAYNTSDAPAFMLLVKRYLDGGGAGEELLIAEAESTKNPEGTTLLQLQSQGDFALSSIVPEFDTNELFVYYYDSENNTYKLEVYALPLGDQSGVEEIADNSKPFTLTGTALVADGEICIHALDGKLVASGNNSVEFASLASGVYVISVNGKSYKIVK